MSGGLLPRPEDLRVAYIDLCREPSPPQVAELDAYERDRAARLGPADRRRYVAAHCALREEIRRFAGAPGHVLEFERGPHDKPFLAHDPGQHFSMSYAGDIAVIALSRGIEVGVDLERVRAIEAVEELSADHFAEEEHLALLNCEPAARDALFLRGWVRKEACVKAVGYGLWLPTGSFISGFDERTRITELSPGARNVRVAVENLGDAPVGHVAALAVIVRD